MMRMMFQFAISLILFFAVIVIGYLISLIGYKFVDVINHLGLGAIGLICSQVANQLMNELKEK